VDRLADRVLALLVAGLLDRPGAVFDDGLHAGLLDRLVASFAFFAVASLANRLHDGFLDSLVAGMPPLLQGVVVHELVGRLALLLAGREATLRVAGRLSTARVLGGAAMCRRRRLDRPKQADQGDQQGRAQAHPHDLASSLALSPTVCDISNAGPG